MAVLATPDLKGSLYNGVFFIPGDRDPGHLVTKEMVEGIVKLCSKEWPGEYKAATVIIHLNGLPTVFWIGACYVIDKLHKLWSPWIACEELRQAEPG